MSVLLFSLAGKNEFFSKHERQARERRAEKGLPEEGRGRESHASKSHGVVSSGGGVGSATERHQVESDDGDDFCIFSESRHQPVIILMNSSDKKTVSIPDV